MAFALGQFLAQFAFLVAVFGGLVIALTGKNLFLESFHTCNLVLEGDNVFRHLHMGDADAGACFVEGIDGLVRQQPVAHIAFGECDAGVEGLVGILHQVVVLILLLDVLQDGEGLLGGGGLHQYLLEAAFEGAVLFDVLAVLVEGGGSDALDFAAGKSRFEHVGGIE